MLFSLACVVVLLVIAFSWFTIRPYGKYILPEDAINGQNVRVGLVLGAGINSQGKPYEELVSRLDTAARALEKKTIDKVILSGDNRFVEYNEPLAMQKYMVDNKKISPQQLQADFAGRSTYESCERAKKIFGQNRILIISARSHLPRAIYLCRNLGVEAYGLPAPVEANNSFRRELLARVKAIMNVYIVGEKTVLGEPIQL